MNTTIKIISSSGQFLNVELDGSADLISKILRKLEEMANGNGWTLE